MVVKFVVTAQHTLPRVGSDKKIGSRSMGMKYLHVERHHNFNEVESKKDYLFVNGIPTQAVIFAVLLVLD